MAAYILHPDRPDEYLHAGEIIARNRDKSDKHLHVVVDTRYVADQSSASVRVGSERIALDLGDPRHVTCYQVLEELAVEALTAHRNELQAAREARQASSEE